MSEIFQPWETVTVFAGTNVFDTEGRHFRYPVRVVGGPYILNTGIEGYMVEGRSGNRHYVYTRDMERVETLQGLSVRHGNGRVGTVLEDNGGHCVYVRWTDGSMAQGGGMDGWYSRHALMPTDASHIDNLRD
ncbi:hypothetical protein PBI_PAT3_138 [Mycobacterium phage Pat3]|nr:hypothetical protein PBI_PAT3_138 [Mycobacterium phage Pat3]